MIDYIYQKAPSPEVLSQVAMLYQEAGWWEDAPQYLDQIADIVKGSYFFITAVSESQVVGMGRAISDGVSDAYIQDVAVKREWQGQGIARAIVKHAVTTLRQNQIQWIGLIAERGTHGVYRPLGFVPMKDSLPLVLEEDFNEV